MWECNLFVRLQIFIVHIKVLKEWLPVANQRVKVKDFHLFNDCLSLTFILNFFDINPQLRYVDIDDRTKNVFKVIDEKNLNALCVITPTLRDNIVERVLINDFLFLLNL
jgi:hypothetical protein